MSLAKRYLNWSQEGKTMFWLLVVDLAVFLALVPFFLLSNIGLPLGWLLGAVVVAICYLSVIKGTGFILQQASDANGRNKGMAMTMVFSLLRLLLIVGALVFAAFMTFKVEGGYVNFFTCAAAYIPLILVIIVFNLTRRKKKKPTLAEMGKKDLEEGEEAIDE